MNKDLMREIYDAYAKEINLYLYSLCKNSALAEDLMHDVFVQAIMSLSDDHPNFRAWLYKVAHNLCINRLRKDNRLDFRDSIPEDGSGHFGSSDDALADMLTTERNRTLYRCMNKLPDLHREILFMEYFSEMNHKEIAVALDLSPNNVRVIAHRARKELKSMLEKEEEDDHEL